MKTINSISLMLLLATTPFYTSQEQVVDCTQNDHATKASDQKANLQKLYFKNQVKELYTQTAKDLQDLSEIKKAVTKAELQPAIQNIDRFLCKLKNFLYSLYTYLSKSTHSEEDNQYINGQYLQFKYLFQEDAHDEQLMANKQYAVQQKHNLELLKDYYAIEKKQQDQRNQGPNLGNWIRNTNFSPSKPVTNKAALEALKRHNDKISQKSRNN